MSKLVFGKNGQVRFNSEEELRTAVDYILNSSNVEFDIHEDNQNQGAWAPEERIHNCGEFCELVRTEAHKRKK